MPREASLGRPLPPPPQDQPGSSLEAPRNATTHGAGEMVGGHPARNVVGGSPPSAMVAQSAVGSGMAGGHQQPFGMADMPLFAKQVMSPLHHTSSEGGGAEEEAYDPSHAAAVSLNGAPVPHQETTLHLTPRNQFKL